jgi:tetratricopeptide (TPR) repeat protein
MKRVLFAVLGALAAFALFAGPAASGEARRAMDEGSVLFAAGSYTAAAGKFEEAATLAGGEGLEPEAASYNAAVSLLKVGKAPEAVTAFTQAQRSADPGLRGRAHYNRGIALVAVAEVREKGGDVQGAVVSLGQALEAYESAMLIDAKDEDPKVNHELASRKKAQLEEKLRERPSRAQAPQPESTRQEEQRPRKEMTNDEARLMLEAMKQQEISRRRQVQPFRGAPAWVDKDW